ncbi:MAG: response regulator transcription factor [Cyclobacteriaceae bacterium]
MNCIILDDEPHAIDVLKRYVQKTPSLELRGTFRNPLKALDFLHEEKIELIFLDVNMPNLTGIQFLKALKTKPLIIFTTAYSSYAAESYEWDAIDYLVKPITLERFLKAVGKARDGNPKRSVSQGSSADKQDRQEVISLKSGRQIHRVNLWDIQFVSKQSNYLEVNLPEKKILIRANMADIFSWLPEDRFCRIHKSYVVGLRHVGVIESNQIIVNRIALPLGLSYRKDFMEKIEK